MANSKSRTNNEGRDEEIAKRVLAQVRILDSSEQLRDMQRQMRRNAQVFTKLQNLPTIPDAALRELLSKLKKSAHSLASQMADMKENLDIACNLLKPPG